MCDFVVADPSYWSQLHHLRRRRRLRRRYLRGRRPSLRRAVHTIEAGLSVANENGEIKVSILRYLLFSLLLSVQSCSPLTEKIDPSPWIM